MLRTVVWVIGGVAQLLSRKVLDLLADNTNTSLVRGIEFQNSRGEQRWSEQFLGQREDGRCFSCPWGSVEEHMWQIS